MTRFTRRYLSLFVLILLGAIAALAQTPELVVQSGSTGNLMSVAFSPDGKTLASGSWDINAQPRVKLWEVATGLQLRTLEGSENQISVAFTPDGRFLITAGIVGDWGGIKLWDVATGKQLRSFEGASPIALSPDGKTLAGASGVSGNEIRLWDIAGGALLRTMETRTLQIATIAFSPDGTTVASGAKNYRTTPTVELWEVKTGALLRTLEVRGDSGDVQSLAFSPDGKFLAVGDNQTARSFDVGSGAELPTISRDHCCANSLAFSPDQKIIAFGRRKENIITLRDVARGVDVRTLKGMGPMVFSADGRMFAGGDKTSFESHNAATIKLWDVASGAELRTLSGRPENGVECVAISPDGRTVASGTQGDNVKLRDVATGTERVLKGYETGVNAMATPGVVAFSPDGRKVAAGDSIHVVTIWDVASGRKLGNFTDDTLGGSDEDCDDQGITSLAFSSDGRTLAVGTDTAMALWNVNTHRRVRSYKSNCDDPNEAAFNPDGRTVAITGKNDVQIRNVVTGTIVRSLPETANSIAYSSNGKILATGSSEQIKLWNVATGALMRTFNILSGSLGLLAISADGSIIAVSNGDTVQLWDAATGKPVSVATKAAQSRPIEALTFGRGGYLIGASWDDVRIWDAASGQQLAQFIPLTDADWLAISPDGLFDGSPAAWRQILWRFNNNTFDHAPVEAFFNEFYYPGLLQDIFAGKYPRAPSDISQKDRRQPRLKLTLASSGGNRTVREGARNAAVKVDITESAANKDHKTGSGAQDVRLFRNGSLVKVWRGDVLRGQSSVTLEETVPIVAGENRFTAYAFNHDNIKSSDAELTVTGADGLKRQGTAYILAIGVNHYANQNYNLKYAVADADDFAAEVKRQQESLKRYAKVEVISLSDTQATKANITQKLADLAKQVQPEDAVIVFFAGHGTAHGNEFYLIPRDLGYDGPRENLTEKGLQSILAHSISDRDLENSFETIDAGQLLLVIDACNSGRALEAEEKRRGPMNSKGLAQLAYEKGMYVLTAAQSYQAAQEAASYGHGFLTYALVEKGLKQGAADREPKNGSIDVREWLDFATDEVPKMQEQNSADALRGRGRYVVFVGDGREVGIPKTESDTRDNVQRPRVFYRRELENNPLVVGRAGASPNH